MGLTSVEVGSDRHNKPVHIFLFLFLFLCWYACCLLVIFNICRTNSYVYSFPAESQTCKDDSAQTSTSSIPRHTLRSFNYLMQDAGIMLGRHLKGAPAFIYWDGSSVRRKEKRSAWVARRLFMVSSKAHLSMSPSSSVFAFQFLSLFGRPGSSALCISTPPPPPSPPWRSKETSSHRQGWQVNLRGSHDSNFTFQRLLFTGLRLRDLLYCLILFFSSSFFSFFFLSRFCQKHYKDGEHQYGLHSKWSIYLVKLKKKTPWINC